MTMGFALGMEILVVYVGTVDPETYVVYSALILT